MAFVLRSPKFFEFQYSYTSLRSGETKLIVSWVYVYDDRAYTYIVTGEWTSVVSVDVSR